MGKAMTNDQLREKIEELCKPYFYTVQVEKKKELVEALCALIPQPTGTEREIAVAIAWWLIGPDMDITEGVARTLVDKITAALASVRERCARIAEDFKWAEPLEGTDKFMIKVKSKIGEMIAKAIREQGKEKPC